MGGISTSVAAQGTSCDARDNLKRSGTHTDLIRTNGFAEPAVSTERDELSGRKSGTTEKGKRTFWRNSRTLRTYRVSRTVVLGRNRKNK